VRVFAVWFRMYPGDSESRWPRGIFTDPRVQQRWDEPKMAGRWFLDNLGDLKPARRVEGRFPQRVDAMWDTWMLFDRKATWKERPGGLVSWGYTIMATRAQLQEDLESLAAASRRPTVSRPPVP
jgi:hypothetical protein